MTEINLDEIANLVDNQTGVSSEADAAESESVEEAVEDSCEGCSDCKCDDKEEHEEEKEVSENVEYTNPITEEYKIEKNNWHGAPVYPWSGETARISNQKIVF